MNGVNRGRMARRLLLERYYPHGDSETDFAGKFLGNWGLMEL